MKIASNLCCSLEPYYYCKTCKYKLCTDCLKNLSARPRLEAKWGSLAKVMLDHSHHSLCIKRDIVLYGNVYNCKIVGHDWHCMDYIFAKQCDRCKRIDNVIDAWVKANR